MELAGKSAPQEIPRLSLSLLPPKFPQMSSAFGSVQPPPVVAHRRSQLPSPPVILNQGSPRRNPNLSVVRSRSSSSVHGPLPEPSDVADDISFDRAVSLFNAGDYYRCHDYLEELWTTADEPDRTILHGILQCAVGLHHLFNQNHRGAMMEMGEGLCKMRKMEFEKDGPLFRFEREVSEVLEFVYQTQKELAACTDDLCVTMDGSERSYQLLGSFAAGQHLYDFDIGSDKFPYIVFRPNRHEPLDKSLRVRVPTLTASEKDLKACSYTC